jgi:hypothetical protein
VLLYASNGRLEGWASLDVGGPVELLKWRSASSLEAAPMWVCITYTGVFVKSMTQSVNDKVKNVAIFFL